MSVVLRARWIFPVSAPPIDRGWIELWGGRIRRLCPDRKPLPEAARVVDYPAGVVTPGWIDAHAHLDLGVVEPIGAQGGFTAWARKVIDARSRSGGAPPAETVRQASRGRLLSGATAAGDHAASPACGPAQANGGLKGVSYLEGIGFSPAGTARAIAQAQGMLLAEAGAPAAGVKRGLAAHAPYSVSPALFRWLRARANERGLRLSVHLAETREESEFLASGEGPWRTLLEERGSWDPAWAPPRLTPVQYLESLGFLGSDVTAAHANYLSRRDIEILAGRKVTVAYCPGTHAWFGNPAHPLPDLLEAGVSVALGTDSPASNPHCDLRAAAAQARREFPGIPAQEILRMLTMGGAQSLGQESELGDLTVGKAADLAVFKAPEGADAGQVLEHLMSGMPQVESVWVDGALRVP